MLTLGRLGCSSILAAAGIQRREGPKAAFSSQKDFNYSTCASPSWVRAAGEKREEMTRFSRKWVCCSSLRLGGCRMHQNDIAPEASGSFLKFHLLLSEVSMLLCPLKMETGVCTEEREPRLPEQPVNSLLSASTAVSLTFLWRNITTAHT